LLCCLFILFSFFLELSPFIYLYFNGLLYLLLCFFFVRRGEVEGVVFEGLVDVYWWLGGWWKV
jgi:hypothetical protein